MNLDDHKKDWRDRHEIMAVDHLEKSMDIVHEVMTMERSMHRSDLRELYAAGLTIIILIVLLATPSGSIIQKLGFTIAVLSGCAGVLSLHLSKRKTPKPSCDLPLENFCRAELDRVERRIELMRNFVSRFTFPMTIGLCIFMLGLFLEMKQAIPTMSNTFFFGWLAAFYFCFMLAMIVMKRGANRDIRNRYGPIRDDLLKTIDSLREPKDDQVDQTRS